MFNSWPWKASCDQPPRSEVVRHQRSALLYLHCVSVSRRSWPAPTGRCLGRVGPGPPLPPPPSPAGKKKTLHVRAWNVTSCFRTPVCEELKVDFILFVSLNIKYNFSCFRGNKFLWGSLWEFHSSSHLEEVMVDYPQHFVCRTETHLLVHVSPHTHAHLKGKLHMVLICGGVRRGSVRWDRLVVLVLARRGTGSVFTYIHKQWLGVGGVGCTGWAPGMPILRSCTFSPRV